MSTKLAFEMLSAVLISTAEKLTVLMLRHGESKDDVCAVFNQLQAFVVTVAARYGQQSYLDRLHAEFEERIGVGRMENGGNKKESGN